MADQNGATFTVTPEVSEALFKQFSDILEARMKATTAEIVNAVEAQFAKIGTAATKSMTKAATEAVKAGQAVRDLGGAANAANHGIEAQVTSLLATLDKVGRSIKENVSVLTSIREANRRTSVELTARSQDVARQQIEDTRRASTQFVIEQQRLTSAAKSASEERIQQSKNENRLAVIAAQASASRRIVILQAALQTIGRLEKGLGAAIAGTARTATAAFSKIFDSVNARRGGGIAGAVRGQNTELNSILRQTNEIVQTNTKKINNSFIEGTSRTMNTREDIIRRSFIEQEQIVKKSAVRQAAALDAVRKTSSTGVAGAITGRGLGLGIGGLIAGAGIGAFFKEGFKQSVDLNEQMNKTRVVFGDAAQSVIDFSSDAVNSLGATKAEALGASATFGNLFRAIGISEKPAAKMSTSLVQLAADLSSFNNVPIDQAFAAIQSGLTGETEPLKKFGVNLNEATLKAKALELGLSDGKGVLTANAKANAAYALILEQTTLAQGDFARTADQGANAQRRAQKASIEFAAAIAGKLQPAATALFNGLVTGFTVLTKVIQDTTNPVLKVLKDGLFGAAAGLAAIIAAKGAVQVFQLLGQAIKLTLTPMGALLVGAAILGAGLSILLKRSATAREAFGALEDRLADLAKRVIGVARGAFAFLVRFLDNTIIPAFVRLADFLADHVVTAFDATQRFIVNVAVPAIVKAAEFIARNATAGWRILVRFFEERVIPVFKTIVSFIDKSVIPRLIALAKVVKEDLLDALKILVNFVTGSVYPALFSIGLALGPTGLAIAAVTAAIIFFWDSVRPVIQPAIDGFKILGEAIKTAFGIGDLSGIGAGFKAAGAGILTVLSTIGGLIVDVLSTAFNTVVSTLKRVFSLTNLISAGKGFLDFVEFIGRTLGKVVTDPKFITAVAAIGAALAGGAALVAFRFLKGFTDAFLNNLGDNVSLIVGALLIALTAAFKAALSNPQLVAVVVFGIIALFQAKRLISGITEAGSKAGGGFFKGFTTSIKKSTVSNAGLLAGFFSGTGADSPAKASAKFFKEQENEMIKMQKRLRAFGSTSILQLNPTSLAAGKAELDKLSAGLSDARTKGLLLRDTFNQSAKGIANAFAGTGKVIVGSFAGVSRGIVNIFRDTNAYTGAGKGVGRAFMDGFGREIPNAGQQIKAGLGGIWRTIKDNAISNGQNIGQALGKALAKSAVAAVSLVGGFTAGKAEGQAGGSGILSALLGGVTAGAVVGGPFGVAVGAATAGVALFGAALGRAEKDAKAFREEVGRLTSAFKDDLINAIEDGIVHLNTFGATKIDTKTVLGLGDNFQETVDALAAKLKPEQIQTLLDAFGSGAVSRVAKFVQDANGDVEKFNKTFTDALLDNTAASDEFNKRFGKNAAGVKKALEEIVKPGGPATIKDFLNDNTFSDSEVSDAIRKNKVYASSVIDTANAAQLESAAIVQATKDVANLAIATADVPKLQDAVEHGSGRALDSAGRAALNASQFVSNVIPEMKKLQDLSIRTFNDLINTGDTADEAAAKLKDIGLPPVPTDVANSIQKKLQDIAADAEAVNTELDKMPQAFADAINAANGVQSTLSIDQAILGSGNIARSIQDAISKGPGSVTGNAELSDATRQAGEVVGKALADGVQSKTIFDEASARSALAPVQAAMLEALGPRPDADPAAAAAFDQSVAAIKAIFETGLTGIQATIDKEAMLKDVSDFMSTHTVPVSIAIREVNAANGTFGTADAARQAALAANPVNSLGAPAGHDAPLIGSITIVEANNPNQTANKVVNAVRSQTQIWKGVG